MNNDQIKKKIKTMDIILGLMFISIIVFVVTMIVVFLKMGAIPDTLVVSVFGFFGFEAGVMGWIKNTKTKWEEKINGSNNNTFSVFNATDALLSSDESNG